MTEEMNSSSSATPKTISDVKSACRTSPLTRHTMASRSSGSSSVSIIGPKGQKVSKPFALVNCTSFFWRSRAVMSFAAV
ncbi:hypothetical protein BH18ACT5_BH18ACT5_18280 [soil metagenome]